MVLFFTVFLNSSRPFIVTTTSPFSVPVPFRCSIQYGSHSRWRQFDLTFCTHLHLSDHLPFHESPPPTPRIYFPNLTDIRDFLATFSHSLRFTALLLLDMSTLISVIESGCSLIGLDDSCGQLSSLIGCAVPLHESGIIVACRVFF